MAASLAAMAAAQAESGFTGAFDIAGWTFVSGGSNAQVTADSSSIQINGSQNGDDIESQSTFFTNVAGTYYLTFNWTYVTTDPGGPGYDPGGYLMNAGTVQLSNDSGASTQSGGVTSIAFTGGAFGFYVHSDNFSDLSNDGYGTLTISNFQFSTTPSYPTWTGSSSGNWNASGNWTGGVPNSASATAQFGASTHTSGTINTNITVGQLIFTETAGAYTLTIPNSANRSLTLSGSGIINNSGAAQTIANKREMTFDNSAGAGNATITNSGANATLNFLDNSSAENATITNSTGGNLLFSDSSSAGNANITLASGAAIVQATASLGNATIAIGNSTVYLWDQASAGHAAITVNSGGVLDFSAGASGGTAAVTLSGGNLYLEGSLAAGLSLGSLGGNGTVMLGGKNLAVGSRNTSTTLGASLSDTGPFASGPGSLTKTGSGALTLTGQSSYTGGTVVSSGTLIAGNAQAVGTGTVTVQSGGTFLTDSGIAISNPVVLSGGSYGRRLGAGASLAGTLSATSNLASPASAVLLAGTLSASGTVTASFSAAAHGSASDILQLSGLPAANGSATDLFVLQLSMTSVAPGSYLGWLNGGDEWVNAALGNTGNNATAAQSGYSGSFSAFQGEFGTLLSGYIGAWGFTNTSVWAVLDHNSDFGVVPEPSAGALLLAGLAACAILLRRSGAQERGISKRKMAPPGSPGM